MTEFADCPVDLHYLAENQPSLCIPRVFPNIKEDFIRSTFDKLALGKIQRIDLIERRTERGEVHNRVFIHFEKWFWNADAQEARKRLITGKDVKIVYDNPWFWKVSANKWSPRTSDYRGTQLPNVARPTQPFIAPDTAPTLNVAPTLSGVPMPDLPPPNDRRKKRPVCNDQRLPAHDRRRQPQDRPRNNHRYEDRRHVPEMHTPVTPPPSRDRLPRTPPGAPKRPTHPSHEDMEIQEDDMHEKPTNSDFSDSYVPNISYGDAPYPPPPKRGRAKMPNLTVKTCDLNDKSGSPIPPKNISDDIDELTKEFEIVVNCNEK